MQGMALNIGIALRCNLKTKLLDMGWVECDWRRRCWTAVPMLHTYQVILCRDVDVSSRLEMEPTMPANVNDSDIQHDMILYRSSQPIQMSVRYDVQAPPVRALEPYLRRYFGRNPHGRASPGLLGRRDRPGAG